MANEALKLGTVTLEARHIPEPDATYDPAAHDDPNHVTGFVEIGALVDGAFIPLARRKASGVFADIYRAQQTGPAHEGSGNGEPPPAEPPASPGEQTPPPQSE